MATNGRQVVVITGGSAGVGRATARAFAERGADVALLARGQAGLEGAAKDVEAAGGRALPIPTDVSDWVAVDAAADRVEAELGPIDVWVNDAMTTVFAWFHDVDPEEFRRATEVTYLGQVYGTMAALRRMRPRDRGTVVNVGSALAYVAIPLQAAYCGAKYAVRGFTEGVQAELLASGSDVRVAIVHLPAVNTPQFEWCRSKLPRHPQPVPPIYEPEDCARAILRASEEGRRTRVFGSWNRALVTAARIWPTLAQRYAARTAVASQQIDRPTDPDRPSNLFAPVDDADDHGAHGIFDERAGGASDPSFLSQLPKTARDLAVSAGQAVADVFGRH